MQNSLKALRNIHEHPLTTIAGAVLATALSMTSQPDAKHLVLAFLTLLLGMLAKDPVAKAGQ